MPRPPDALKLPFVCSSAVLDALTDEPTDWVARVAPAQSHGWGGSTHAVLELDLDQLAPQLLDSGATAVLLLTGHPEPAVSLVQAIRREPRLSHVLIGAPAGQPELAEWLQRLGGEGAAVPFLRYLPERLTALGDRVESALRERLGEPPSFVAFEGYDTIAVLRARARWPDVAVQGTRGEIRFSRPKGSPVWQWAWPPVQVADRDPAQPERFRVLHVTTA